MSNIFKISQTENSKLEEVYKNSMVLLKSFFGLNWTRNTPKIYLVDSRKTIDGLEDKQTPEWLVGWATERTVYVLEKDAFDTDSNHNYSEKDYEMLITHELAHLFFKVITGNKTGIKWLWEGVSVYISGQAETWERPKTLHLFLDDPENKVLYSESGYAVLLLIKHHGKDKFIQLLKKYKNYTGEFSNLFEETYGIPLSYESFNQLILK